MPASTIFTPGNAPLQGVARKLALAAAGSLTIPQGATAIRIHIRNNTANAVTGGIKIGTTVGAADIVAAQAVGASAVVSATPLISTVSTAGVRTIYIDAVTAWNAASVDVAIEWLKVVA